MTHARLCSRGVGAEPSSRLAPTLGSACDSFALGTILDDLALSRQVDSNHDNAAHWRRGPAWGEMPADLAAVVDALCYADPPSTLASPRSC